MNTQDLLQLAEPFAPNEGVNETAIERVSLFRASQPVPRQPILYESWIVALLRGEKTIHQDGQPHPFVPGDVLCVTPGSPVECETRVVPSQPLIGVVVDVSFDDMLAMATRMRVQSKATLRPPHLMDIFKMSASLHGSFARLLELLKNPDEAAILGPGVVTEIIYRVLEQRLAASLVHLASNSNTSAVLRALRHIQKHYADDFQVESIASDVGMSASSFHLHFKQITSHSPLRFVKCLRLNKARALIRSGNASIGEAAFAVGYKSAAQFSREYKGYFGVVAKQDLPRSRRDRVAVPTP